MLKYAASPETVGVSSAGLNRFLDALAASSLELHSVVLLRHGQIAWEMSVSPYDVRTPHVLFSLSKSFTSAAVGFAVAEGLMAYDERICDILPDKAPDGASALLKAVTIHDLLCMGSGLSAASDGIDPEQPDWAKRVLSFPVEHTPGTHFQYNSMGTFLCSQAVQRRTGMTVLAYLTPRLFAPLGIETPRWDESPQGVSCGGWGLHLSTLDVAKFGQLLLRDGVWGGTRVLPEGWVDMATSRKIDNSGRGAHPDWEQGYGYQFWRCRDGAYRGGRHVRPALLDRAGAGCGPCRDGGPSGHGRGGGPAARHAAVGHRHAGRGRGGAGAPARADGGADLSRARMRRTASAARRRTV